MKSSKARYFSDGTYEKVLVAKAARPNSKFGHSPYSKDSYLSTQVYLATEGADTGDDPQNRYQEDFDLNSAPRLDDQAAELLQASLTENREAEDGDSEDSEVDSDTSEISSA
jgi:hypothetical protein